MIPQIAGLTREGIDDYIKNLKYKIEVGLTWSDLAKSRHGEFLKVQLEKELTFWKRQYSQIDAGSPAATNLLSFIQGVEMTLERQVNQLQEKSKQVDLDQKELESIGEFLKNNRDQKDGQTLLPRGYVKKEKS